MAYAYDNDDFSRYYDTLVSEHLSQVNLWIDTVEKIYADIIRQTIVDEHSTTFVVELGCGTADNLISFQKLFATKNLHFLGIDLSQAMLDRAKEKLKNLSASPIELRQGNITSFSTCLEKRLADCILLPAGTFHHLITDHERQEFLNHVRRSLRPATGLCAVYLLPDAMIHAEPSKEASDPTKFQMIAAVNQQQADQEWICQQKFAFNGPPKIELAWQLRTCSAEKLIAIFLANQFEVMLCCVNGNDLITYEAYRSLSSMDHSTPVIIVVRTKNNTN
jgi:ubiquinone/menaquinone biosynthesis C-methylase UbiE